MKGKGLFQMISNEKENRVKFSSEWKEEFGLAKVSN